MSDQNETPSSDSQSSTSTVTENQTITQNPQQMEAASTATSTDVQSSAGTPVITGAQEVATAQGSTGSATGDTSAPRAKIQLNPTQGHSFPMEDLSPKGPVEIPDDAELDAETEAALNQAMGGDMQISSAAQLAAHAAAAGETYTPPPLEELEPGTKLKGKIVGINGEDIHVEVGYPITGLLKTKNFAEGKVPAVGSIIDVMVEQVDQVNNLIMLNNPRGVRKIQGNWDALAVGMTVECMVNSVNKGGLSVTISNIKGFLPKSQIDLGFIEDLEPFVNQKLTVKVTDLDPKKRNLVVSRKQILIEERESQKQDAWSKIEEGQEITGTVKTLKDYGAFIDLGGVDGLLHVGEISWNRINHPQDVLSIGQQIQVKILKIEPDKKKISLGMKQLASNPWEHAEIKYAKDSIVTGTVSRMTEFGAFVELEKGVEGLLHISEIEHRRIPTVQDVLKIGQEIQAKVLEFNKNKKRISLSMKALLDKPEPVKPAVQEEQPQQPQDQRSKKPVYNPNLKGGMGGQSQGGLFGNPRDFK